MSNFIGMVFATLKKEGIDTSKMDTSEAIAKYNEIQGNGGGSSAKEETPKAEQKTETKGKQTAEKGTIEKDSTDATVSKKETVEEEPKKVDASELYDESRKDKYGNPMLSKKYHDIAKQAGQEYIDSMTKYYSMDKLIQSNVFPGYLCNKICDGLNEATNDIPDITTTEIEEIVSELTGYNFNYDEYETGRGGYTTYFSKKQSAPGTAEKMSTAMGVSPDEAKAFVSGKGSLSKGGYEGVSNVKSAPTFEYNAQKYTGDKARFNNLFTGFEKGWGERAVNEELANIGFNEGSIANFNSIRKTLKLDNEQAIEVLASMFNISHNRK